MAKKKPGKTKGRPIANWHSKYQLSTETELRIIGGNFRGRKIRYSGDQRTRPMKDVTREAIFNLIGGWIEDKIAFDLFAGTGAIGFESLSRGADHCFFVERHVPTMEIVEQNAKHLEVCERSTVESADTFFWVKDFLKNRLSEIDQSKKWAVFCSPPYDFFVERKEPILDLIHRMMAAAPPESVFVIESDQRFDLKSLPDSDSWKIREYAPAVIAVQRPKQTYDGELTHHE